jgi:hypothetical protein
MRRGDCVRQQQALECTYVTASGRLREEQLVLRFLGDAQGKVDRVQVVQARRWRWK